MHRAQSACHKRAHCSCTNKINWIHFMSQTEIVSSMDHINELAIIVAGHVEIVDPSNMAGMLPATFEGVICVTRLSHTRHTAL